MCGDSPRRSWDILILVFVMYNSVSVPYEASFRYTKTALQNHIETVIDILFALDVVITFRTAYIDNHAIMVRDGGKIVMHYVKTWFLIDLMASLPLDSFVLLFNSSGNANLTYFALLKVGRRSVCCALDGTRPSARLYAASRRLPTAFARKPWKCTCHDADPAPATIGPPAALPREDQARQRVPHHPAHARHVSHCALDRMHLARAHRLLSRPGLFYRDHGKARG